MTTLPLRLDRIKSGYTDGARQLASRAVRVLSESRVTPNQLTALGFSLNIVAAVLIYQELYIAAAAVFLVGSIIDILDGALARSRGQATTFGAFIDSTTDRISEGAVLCAVDARVRGRRRHLARRGRLRRAGRLVPRSRTRAPAPRPSASTARPA